MLLELRIWLNPWSIPVQVVLFVRALHSSSIIIVMKKIGIVFGKERSFPMAFIDRVNSKGVAGITAEPVRIDKVMQGEPTGYAVIIDRISQDVPFYRAYLKNAAL